MKMSSQFVLINIENIHHRGIKYICGKGINFPTHLWNEQ
jgi:hypothetical protein